MYDSGKMMRKIESQQAASAVGTGLIALYLGRFLASLAAAGIGVIFLGLFNLFGEVRRPFKFIAIVGGAIAIASFCNSYLHWFGSRMLTPVAMLLLLLMLAATTQLFKEIDALPEACTATAHRNIGAAVIFIVPFLFYAYSKNSEIAGLYVWAGLGKGHAVMAANATFFMLAYLLLVVFPMRGINMIAKGVVNEAYSHNLSGDNSAQYAKEMRAEQEEILNNIDRINNAVKLDLSAYVQMLSIAAVYLGLIWYFADFNISTYNLAMF